jgi:hypothetical protein
LIEQAVRKQSDFALRWWFHGWAALAGLAVTRRVGAVSMMPEFATAGWRVLGSGLHTHCPGSLT